MGAAPSFIFAITLTLSLAFFSAGSGPAEAAEPFPLSGKKTITLHPHEGAGVVIGDVTFTPDKEGRATYSLHIDHSRMKDFFLSMKEFKCLESPKEVLCHAPYPYPNPAWVTAENMSWLEHSLLFLHKSPSEFGARLWNGLIYDMAIVDGGIEGSLQAVDLNEIASPPDDETVPPYGEYDRGEASIDSRWMPRITIR